MTINDPEIIKTLLENDGTYPGDPRMALIYAYKTIEGAQVYAVFMDEQHDDMRASPYVVEPVLLWTRTGLTAAGENVLAIMRAAW